MHGRRLSKESLSLETMKKWKGRKQMGVDDINKVLTINDLASGNVMFVATGSHHWTASYKASTLSHGERPLTPSL